MFAKAKANHNDSLMMTGSGKMTSAENGTHKRFRGNEEDEVYELRAKREREREMLSGDGEKRKGREKEKRENERGRGRC